MRRREKIRQINATPDSVMKHEGQDHKMVKMDRFVKMMGKMIALTRNVIVILDFFR
jgi:hypothetical protein